MASSRPVLHLLDARELDAAVVNSNSNMRTLIDEHGFQLHRFRQAPSHFEVDGLVSHVLSLQHAKAPMVTARVGDAWYSKRWERGSFNLVPAGTPLSIRWQSTVDVTGVWLSPQHCERLLEAPRFDIMPRFGARNPAIADLVALLSRSAEAADPYGRLYREGLIVSLVACLGNWKSPGEERRHRCGLAPIRLKRVLDFIEANLVDDMSLAALAAEAGVSERHFCTMFGLAMGQPPHRYMIGRRVEQAKIRLREHRSTSITEIAMSVGFKSSSHFATMFRKTVGLTPGEYRREVCVAEFAE